MEYTGKLKLTREQVLEFHQRGFLVLDSVLDSHCILALQQDCTNLLEFLHSEEGFMFQENVEIVEKRGCILGIPLFKY